MVGGAKQHRARRPASVAVTAAILLALATGVLASSGGSCSGPSSPVIIASFASAAAFENRENDLVPAGSLTDSNTMSLFQRANDAFLEWTPTSASTSMWMVTVPEAAEAALPLAEVHGGVLSFQLGGGSSRDFTVTITVQASAGDGPLEKYDLPARMYVPVSVASQPSSMWTTVRMPILHFGLPPQRLLRAITFHRFADGVGKVSRLDDLHMEYHACPRRLAMVPPQTCASAHLVVDDFTDVTRFAARLNSLGGGWTHEDTMRNVRLLSPSDTHGAGLFMEGNDESYWYTMLMSADGKSCLQTWPYTTLRVVVAGPAGLQFAVEPRRASFDCSRSLDFFSLPTKTWGTFRGLDDPVTLDIQLGVLPRNPIRALAFSGFSATGAADGAHLPLVFKEISYIRDCARVEAEKTEIVPPIMDWCGPSDERLVVLSFDGPDKRGTDVLINHLNARNAKATFFIQPGGNPVYGNDSLYYMVPIQGPEDYMCQQVRRVIANGHDFGDHSFTHPRFPTLTDLHFLAQLERPEVFYRNCLGYLPHTFRPPFGELKRDQLDALSARNFTVVQWNLESNDHIEGQNAVDNLKAALEAYRVANGDYPTSAIALMHDIYTSDRLPELLDHFAGLNYRFITVSECLERCIHRAYDDQPAWEADHRGCVDPRNPTMYTVSSVLYGQWWLRNVPVTTVPDPPPLTPAERGGGLAGTWAPPSVQPTGTGGTGTPTNGPTDASPTTPNPTAASPAPSSTNGVPTPTTTDSVASAAMLLRPEWPGAWLVVSAQAIFAIAITLLLFRL